MATSVRVRTPVAALDAMRAVVGPGGWIDSPDAIEPYVTEWRRLYRGTCEMVVRPASTAEVASVVGISAGAGIPVFPQGGNTGLVGGGVPDGGIVLSTARLNRVRAIDPVNRTMTVEAGVILADVQRRAAAAGCLFPLSLGAEGSCRIGGNLSTNAGGVQVLRYGNARDLVLGLEVVLPDGRVWDGLSGLRKDNTGYDLKHLFLGAEGTLGVITAAVLKLFPRHRHTETALVAASSVDALMTLFSRVRDGSGEGLTAFEIMSRIGIDFALAHVPGIVDPFDGTHPEYALLELSSTRDDPSLRQVLEEILAEAIEDGFVADAVIAASEAQTAAFWRIREGIVEAQKMEGGSIKHDVSVPLSKVPEFIERATRAVEESSPGIRVVAFGHMGDGNVHFNLSQPVGMDTDAFLGMWTHFNRLVHDVAVELGGSFSAEHGIGKMRLGELEHYGSAVELDLMRTVKAAIDPLNIMNPGKLVPRRGGSDGD